MMRALHEEVHSNWLKEMGGRRRLVRGYGFTNDPEEGKRQGLEHGLQKLIWRGNYKAPLREPPGRILDVGCGTGIWGRDMAQEFPQAKVTCLDHDGVLFHWLEQRVPPQPNVNFFQADARGALPFQADYFDFTHARLPEFLSEEQWPLFIRELARITNPEGWVEICTIGFYFTGLARSGQESPAVLRLLEVGMQDATMHGVTLGGLKFREYLAQAGIPAHVYEKIGGKPGGPKQQKLLLQNILHLEHQLLPSFVRRGLMSAEEFEQCIKQLEADANTYGFYAPYLRTWFQPKDMTSPVPGK